MSRGVVHEKSFITKYRCGCRCGYMRPASSREEATKFLLAHLTNPETEKWLGASYQEHAACKLDAWAGRWSVCLEHRVYVDNHTRPQNAEQEGFCFT